jgi:zinc transporter ZupT
MHLEHAYAKRASTCPTSTNGNHYNTPLQVGAVFIILFVSGMACCFPTLAKHFPGLRLSPRFFFAVRHFGTGVLIATAFVHLLPTAFISLGNQCLSGFWTSDYPAMPGAISLAGIFLVCVIEMVFHPARKTPPAPIQDCCNHATQSEAVITGHNVCTPPDPAIPMLRPKGGRLSSIGRTMSANRAITQSDEAKEGDSDTPQIEIRNVAKPASAASLAEEQKLRKDRLQCVLLEVGILFHSVFIGMALSVSTGSDFVVLLIAITFHRKSLGTLHPSLLSPFFTTTGRSYTYFDTHTETFEGLALGSRIASIAWPRKTIQPWLMSLAYGCTTPIGQAIGLALRSQYSPNSEAGLLLVGVMNAVSAGLLIFASLVELLSEDFLSDESWNTLRGVKRVVACFLVFLGAFLMSLIGAWA